MAKCKSRYCYNETSPKGRSPYCSKCKSRMYAETHPLTHTFHMRRKKARHRGIPWDITLDQFHVWCLRTNYLKLKGTGPDDMTMDRIITYNSDGTPAPYTIDNLQMLPNKDNIAKENKQRKYRKGWGTSRMPRAPDDPF